MYYNNFQGADSNSSPTLSSRFREQGRLEEGDFLLQEVKVTKMEILGKIYDEKLLLKYSGTMESLNTARRIMLLDGKAKGTEAIEVIGGGGLELLILVDRGLDIVSARYKGVNLGFLSKNGITGLSGINPHEDEFLHYFSGGLLTTCGLRNAGPNCREEGGEYHPIHGRYNTLPAQDISIKWISKDIVEIYGVVRETALFGCQLKMSRTITIDTSKSIIKINDVLENESVSAEEFMLLYHFNFGFPMLQDGCKVMFEESDHVTPRNIDAEAGIDTHTEIIAPDDNYKEQVFFHIQKGDSNKVGKVSLVNSSLGLEVTLKQSLETLPVLAQWKSMRSGDYALGLEPTNSFIKGRVEERKNGTLKTIQPFSKEYFELELSVKEI